MGGHLVPHTQGDSPILIHVRLLVTFRPPRPSFAQRDHCKKRLSTRVPGFYLCAFHYSVVNLKSLMKKSEVHPLSESATLITTRCGGGLSF